jgi:small nuclear ribonucleoprotein (snRNP)-like protein
MRDGMQTPSPCYGPLSLSDAGAWAEPHVRPMTSGRWFGVVRSPNGGKKMRNGCLFSKRSIDPKRVAIGLLLLLGVGALHAEISNDVWKALVDKSVTLERSDGSEVPGKLDSVTDKAVVVVKPGGKSVSVAKVDILNVRISMESLASEVSNDVWGALLHQNLVLEKSDGSQVTGQLESVADDTVTIANAKGRYVSVSKGDVQDILLAVAAVPSAMAVSTPEKTAPNAHSPWDWLAVSAGAGFSAEFLTHPYLKYGYSGSSYETTYRYWPTWDFKAFVDLTYIQVSVGYMYIDTIGSVTSKVNGSTSEGKAGYSYSYVTLAAYLKYPFSVGPVKLFPLLGIDYRLNLRYTDDDHNDLKSALTSQQQADLNEIWIEAGAGIDVSIGRFFLRPEVLVGLKPLSKTDNDLLTALRAGGGTDVSLLFSTVRVCVLAGYKF